MQARGEGKGAVGFGGRFEVEGDGVAVDSVEGVEFFDELLDGLAKGG